MEVAYRLARAGIITNKYLVPGDRPQDWDRPSGLRMGTIEISRLGLREADMSTIADFIARVLIDNEDPFVVARDVEDFRLPLQTFYYNFDNGWSSWVQIPEANCPLTVAETRSSLFC